ncbi:MAG: peptide deformylase [Solobacterium sp.]|jgi:peptide deformylase|nr:peptide deformylase [Solobacterium sp.]MCH4222600.1 peptide deformylase [Solobacterium sp.]MCH4265067.1 peptide deformylase [Solobacterium sp.]
MLINNDTIIKDDNALIREQSEPVKLPLSNEDADLLEQLYEYVKDSTDPEISEKENLRAAVGISAIQVGVKKQLTAVIVHDVDKNGNDVTYAYELVNPRITSSSVQKAYLESGEGCLSVVEDHPGYVVRSARVTVKAYDLLQKKDITIRARGYFAIVLQHELDHFKGILFYDHIDPKNPTPNVPNAQVI